MSVFSVSPESGLITQHLIGFEVNSQNISQIHNFKFRQWNLCVPIGKFLLLSPQPTNGHNENSVVSNEN